MDFALLPWTAQHVGTALFAVAVWGMCGWGFLVPNVHRLLDTAPAPAPLLNALNTAVIYLGAAVSGPIGAAAMTVFGPLALGPCGAILVLAGLGLAETARRARRMATLAHPTWR
jgi:predicted MFS family arabinose efflux permease